MSDVGGLQLLPETRKKIEVRVAGRSRPVVLALVFAAIIAVLYFVMISYKSSVLSSLDSVDSKLMDLERARDKQVESSLLDTQKQLSVVNPLINSHVFWSEGLGKIQSVTQPQVQIQTLSADIPTRRFLIKGLAANYTVVAKQIAALYTLESITDILLNKVQTQPTGRLEFTLQISFDADKLLRNTDK